MDDLNARAIKSGGRGIIVFAVLIFVPAGTLHYWQGWALFAAMSFLFLAGVGAAYVAEARPNPALAGLGVDQSAGNLEGMPALPASARYHLLGDLAARGAATQIS